MRRTQLVLAVSAAALTWGCADTPTVAPPAPVRDPLVPAVQPSFAIGGGGPTGAIFTTVPDGSIVNENVRYRDKREVYLDGGPRGGSPQTAAGLDDGDYVFQITDPSGKYLLSQDKSECRLIRVRDGVIVKLLDRNPTTGALTEHSASDACHTNDAPTPPTTAQKTDFGATGKHDTNVDVDYGANGAIVVQMMPYANTPNPGGVYKAWISKIDEYAAKATGKGVRDPFTEPLTRVNGKDAQPCSQGCYQADPGFGPPRNFQKTDNFKVQEEARLRVVKVNDLNGNGVRDGGEPTLEGWDVAFIELLGDGSENVIFDQTTATRTFVPGDQVTVCEASRTNWAFSFATVGGSAAGAPTTRTLAGTTYYCIPVTVGASGTTVEIAFGNFQYGVKSGYKFHDRNIDGVWNTATEEGLAGWTINLTGTDGKGNAVSRTTTTGAGGAYQFTQLAPGTYTVAEVCPAGWYQSYPTPSGACGTGVHTFTIVSGAPGAPDVHANNNFGNYQPSTKTGVKYHDLNGNGTRDAGEPGIAGVTIALLSGGSVVQTTTTDANGAYTLSNILPGTYLVCEVLPAGYVQSAPNSGTTLGTGETLASCPAGYAAQGYQIVVSASAQSFTGNDFGNFQNGSIAGVKISDANGNGAQDAGEVGLANWPVHLFGTTGLGAALHRHATTNASGQFTFANVPPGQYRLCEEQKPGFVQRFPTLATTGAIDCGALLLSVHDPVLPGIGYSLTLQSGQNLNTGFDFLNQPNQGCTPGFWQGGFGIDLWNTVNDPEWGPPRITNGSTNPFIQTTLFNSFFQPAFEVAGMTMLDIVGTGGTEVEARKAARSLIAGYLNTTALSAYPFSQAQLVSMWNAANNSGNGGATRLANLLTLHTQLDAANNLHNTSLCQ